MVLTAHSRLQDFVTEFQKLVVLLGEEFPTPKQTDYGDGYVYRHDKNERFDTLASFLKLVRIVSLCNACVHLMEKGFAQEVYILCRAIVEATEDITFLAMSLGESGTNKDQMRLLNEFFQEEFQDPDEPLSSNSRDRVARKTIRAALSNIATPSGDPHTKRTVHRSINQSFSGYVHGPYPFIMELYDGQYQMNGTLRSALFPVCVDNMPNHIYRSILALEGLAWRVKRPDIARSALELNIGIATETECVGQEGIELLRRRLEPDFLQQVANN